MVASSGSYEKSQLLRLGFVIKLAMQTKESFRFLLSRLFLSFLIIFCYGHVLVFVLNTLWLSQHIEGFASPVLEAAMQVFRRLADISADKDGRNAILSIRLLVRSSQIGCLLGKGGQIITEMRKMSRANIRIPPKEELPVCADDGSELVQVCNQFSLLFYFF